MVPYSDLFSSLLKTRPLYLIKPVISHLTDTVKHFNAVSFESDWFWNTLFLISLFF